MSELSAHQYYLITGGVVAEKYKEFNETLNRQIAARNAFAKRFGSEVVYGNNCKIEGLGFGDGKTPPQRWVRVARTVNVWKPGGRTPEAKELRREMRNLGHVMWRDLQEMLGYNMMHFMTGLTIRCLQMLKVGDQQILQVPKTSRKEVLTFDSMEGCKPIKTSEYHVLLELHEAERETDEAEDDDI